jgi:hypothetical protein
MFRDGGVGETMAYHTGLKLCAQVSDLAIANFCVETLRKFDLVRRS